MSYAEAMLCREIDIIPSNQWSDMYNVGFVTVFWRKC
jgi:hypothetical protein